MSSALASPGASARRTFRFQIAENVSLKSAGPKRVSTTRSAQRSRISSSKAAARSRSVIAERVRVAEHGELGDVAAKDEADRPVGDDAQLPREERELVQVVRPRDEPADETAETEPEHVGDSLVAAEGGHLAEHAVAVWLRLALDVLGQAPGLAERV